MIRYQFEMKLMDQFCFNIKMLFYQYQNPQYEDEIILRWSYHYNGISYTDKTVLALKWASDYYLIILSFLIDVDITVFDIYICCAVSDTLVNAPS